MPQRRWGLDQMLATLVEHRGHIKLRKAYRQFYRFAYQIMMTETHRQNGRWPKALKRKNWDQILELRYQSELEKQYNQEIQSLCKTPSFGIVTPGLRLGEINKKPLIGIVDLARKKAPRLTSMILSIGPSRRSSDSHVVSMKLVTILVILCRSAHRNNSNFLPLLIALYLYSAGAQVDAITLLNRMGLTVSYDVLLHKLKAIASDSALWIKQQASNLRLVGTWDNFEYRENVHGERIGDLVKFKSITMALWVEHGWRIPPEGLKQWMWDPIRELPKPKAISFKAFGSSGVAIRSQCSKHHWFIAFCAGFPVHSFDYSSAMPIINCIDCKTERKTAAYAFAPSMHSKASTAGNIAVFEDLNIFQMGLDKTNSRWADHLMIWWGDLKTEVQMLSMQGHGIGMNRPYERYQHIMPGLALWHLRFNYLKMVWELFYPGGSTSERSTLQWAADHWHRDKTTKPTDFYLLEDLTIHSYWSRIIAIAKTWILQKAPSLQLHDAKAVGCWLENLSSNSWQEFMDWLDLQLKSERTGSPRNWNDHWNNHLCFCKVMEAYMNLCYAIKFGDTGLLRHAIRDVAIILQAPSSGKPKYAQKLLRQLHIVDTASADPVLQEAYLANALVNPRGLPNTFYEMDLILEHQNGEFKRFRSDRGSSLQETDQMFRLHALSVDPLRKVRLMMNEIIVGRERKGRHPEKDSSFDILSLADQLHRSKSTNPDGPQKGKIYFSENQVPDLLLEGKQAFSQQTYLYNKSIRENLILSTIDTKAMATENPPELEELEGSNESVNELFNSARAESNLTSDLSGLLL